MSGKSKEAKRQEIEGKIEALTEELREARAHWIAAGVPAEEIDNAIAAMFRKLRQRLHWHWKCRSWGKAK